MEAKALYAFDASQEDELSFKQGDILKIRNMEDGSWYQAELGGKKGHVPSTYIQMDRHDWYKGKMSRSDAVAFLMRTDPSGHNVYQDGTFVIRDCESDKNQFSLSVKHGSCPQHFKILSNAEGHFYLWPNTTFPSINKLIDHHRRVSIAREPRVTILLRDLQEIDHPATDNPVPATGARPSSKNISAAEEFIAQHDFEPQSQEEVRFKRGDKIRLLEKTDENWWMGLVVSTNEQGLFPNNYVKKDERASKK